MPLLALLVAAGLTIALAQPAVATGTARCFGAAARDPAPAIPCVDPRLNHTAIPRPHDAPLQPSATCTPVHRTPVHRAPEVCAFGVSQQRAASTVALIGDSHATHWRAALAVVARARRWRGVSINRNGCPFTLARTPRNGYCRGWAQSVLRWLRAHPEVRTVVVSANSGAGVVPLPGMTWRSTKVNGYRDAWDSIPRSVRHIYVLRDVPHSRSGTRDCVARAIVLRRNAALRCARPRPAALREDLAAVAAQQARSARVQLIDLTPFMCDDASCFPVVGGALVIKDIGHLTRTFSTTLGPFLGRAIARLRLESRS